ncbi:MAG: 4-hydroxy-3-methylbut-2-en-1-yl diphosphate synthase [Bacteroidetes bacterium]|nr:MAG: 4-hydroxy-3-methylbut-2-en-1-yl diphosphate synthase [Bacteroidota bacterium]RLD95580.1 MAG: 4-hydroxy-3-methylbut-2-en-1-yl diphosphate synthase [Bacteroidota bacterium]
MKPYRAHPIAIGSLLLGGDHPVRIQSMTSTDTNEVQASVDQCVRMIEAGAELVRLTTQGKREVENLEKIREQLHMEGYQVPVVADIHFKPGLALEAAGICDKIRINPGNYLKGGTVDELLPELLNKCREEGTAIRIGVNHGSLDESILEQFGDSPEGMVESAMSFLRICKAESFNKVVVSMKSSNPRVMVQSVRLLAHQMSKEEMAFPLHLGVTEAGDGPEGRIKSAVGMAPLLLESLGDTIRVSLTEPPEMELPVASQIVSLFQKPHALPYHPFQGLAWDPFSFLRRKALSVSGLGKGGRVKIVSPEPPDPAADMKPADLNGLTVPYDVWEKEPQILESDHKILLLEKGKASIPELKSRLNRFCAANKGAPILFKHNSNTSGSDRFQLELAGELGALLVDGLLDGIWVENPHFTPSQINETLLNILQAAGARITKTEYIACPSCGRTHFDILTRLKEIRSATSHLTTLKIGVMGCIVNGPGEMADADYGYVGAGPGRVSIYKGRGARIRNIPEKEALEALIKLVKSEGDWIDP